MVAVSEDNLHFGSRPDDPTGVGDCDSCRGGAVVDGAPCSSCRDRQQLRDAWWNSSSGPQRLRRLLDGL
jgi:hypothetical protein